MESKMLSNFFVPKSSKQFRLKKFDESSIDEIERMKVKPTSSLDVELPVGLWDGCKVNKEYKSLLEILETSKISGNDILLLIQNSISSIKNHQLSEGMFRELISLRQNPAMEIEQWPTPSEIEAVVLWRTTRLGFDDLAQKLQKSTWYVKNCVIKYKKLVKEQKEKRKRERARKRRVVSDLMIENIDRYCCKNKNKALTIAKIKEEVWKNKNYSDPPWNSTIARILKTKQRMSYRTLATRHPKSVQEEQLNMFIEASAIQMQLSQRRIQLVFVDEFHLSWRN